ncbi:Membrane bound O-acyl transferase family [Microdochium nivale]|nr:Membrane bound O-acyl transferase family [Microdochium nivale]
MTVSNHNKTFRPLVVIATTAAIAIAILSSFIYKAMMTTIMTASPAAHLPQHQDLASTYRQLHRARFWADLETGNKRPFLVPLYLCVLYVVPALYLAIPHRDRGGESGSGSNIVYAARWPLLASLVWFYAQMIAHVSSPNFASAYAAGLLGAWGIIWSFTVLVWTRPQWDAKRVELRRRSTSLRAEGQSLEGVSGAAGFLEDPSHENVAQLSHDNGSANGHTTGHTLSSRSSKSGLGSRGQSQGEQNGNSHHENGHSKSDALRNAKLPSDGMNDVEYYWQEFPENASFRTRLNWSFDYVIQFRMTGWNCVIPSLPPYEPPASKDLKQLPLESLPNKSCSGFTRITDRKTFIYQTLLFRMLPAYVLIDVLAVLVTADPHFVVGPEQDLPLPRNLAALHPAARFMWRQLLALLGIISALQLLLNFGQLLTCLLCRPLLGFRAHPWHLPSVTGSFEQVLDRGLAGFWGSWWHQTFRFGFAAPTKWLLRNGYVKKGTFAADAASFTFAFAQSGFLHAAGSYTTVSATKWWMPPTTFLLSGLGMLLQKRLSPLAALLWQYVFASAANNNNNNNNKETATATTTTATPLSPPRWVRRAANLAFVLGWLSLTAWPLLEDFSRGGLWLFEPVPVSLARGLTGLGDPADRRVWRWADRDFYPHWYSSGPSWIWDIGVGV